MKTFTAIMIFAVVWFFVVVSFGMNFRHDPNVTSIIPLFYVLGVAAFAVLLLLVKALNACK